MNRYERFTLALVRASNGCPAIATITVMLFYVMVNVLEAGIETLLYGDRFHHWLDPVLQLGFIAYSAYAVYWCAIYNSSIKSKGK
ncbi:MAG: hypothetical protein GY941_13655 [Planctomycetes bacterium]|nr:hypothetical protein [Planctomycetota bacterium]